LALKYHLQKLRKHLKDGGLAYALARGVRYLLFLFKKKRCVAAVSPERRSISKGGMKITYSRVDGLGVFWEGHELTNKPGLSCGVHTLGFWTDSSKAEWHFIEEKDDRLKVKICFNELPLTQIWTIQLQDGGSFHWSIDMEAAGWLYIDEFRVISLIGHKYKTWVAGYIQESFPRADSQWQDIYITGRPQGLVAVRFPIGTETLPSFSFETEELRKGFSPFVQSPPLDNSTYLIGFRDQVLKSQRRLAPGNSRLFSGKCSFHETDDILDSRIEALRQKDYEKRSLPGGHTDIALIQCPPWDFELPPLGISYLSAYLKRSGYTVSICDLNIALYGMAGEDTKHLWEQKSYDLWVEGGLFEKTWAQLELPAYSFLQGFFETATPRYIGLSVNYASIPFASRLLKMLKGINKDVKIIVGGWASISEPLRKMLPEGLVDVFVVGEGEETLKDVLDALEGKMEPEDVLGAIFNKDGATAYRPRPPKMELDSLPWPTFEEFDLNLYKKQKALPLFTSRGCIGHCAFCNDWNYSKPHRARSARNVFDEISYHVEKNKAEVFHFRDLLCNGDIERLDLLCDLIIGSGLKIRWDSQAIPRKEMTFELLSKMRRAGCDGLSYGVESFSDNVLKQMGKIFTKDIAETVIRDTHRAGISASINIIIGFPGESEEDFKETLDALARNSRYIGLVCNINVCLANPGSELDEPGKKYGLVFPADDKIRAREWATADGENTYQIRKARASRFIEQLERFRLPYWRLAT